MKHLLKVSALMVMAMAVASCGEKKFHVEGHVTDAADSILYFENISLEGPVVLDSVKLSADGGFAFSAARPESPDFYRLRISDQIINVSIDSTETVNIEASYPTMATQYKVSGSNNCQKIKELTLKQIGLQNSAIALSRNTSIGVDEANDSILAMIATYKKDVARNYIYNEPFKAYSYFALFQTLGNWLLFDPQNNTEDMKAFRAVATSWDINYPGTERATHLHNIAIEGMKNQRIVEAENARTIDASKISTTGVLDIALTDNHGQLRHLTELNGKVVLLDFHMFALEDSPQRILMLRELYNKYHDRGLEIYQVSIDPDEHFWKQQTAALPWISVRDADGVNSSNLTLYNVYSIPEFFLLDRENNIVGRSAQLSNLEVAIQKQL